MEIKVFPYHNAQVFIPWFQTDAEELPPVGASVRCISVFDGETCTCNGTVETEGIRLDTQVLRTYPNIIWFQI